MILCILLLRPLDPSDPISVGQAGSTQLSQIWIGPSGILAFMLEAGYNKIKSDVSHPGAWQAAG